MVLRLEGKVSRVADVATTDANGVVSYAVTVAVDQPISAFAPEWTAYLDIASQGVRGVLVLPVMAVRSRDGKPSVHPQGRNDSANYDWFHGRQECRGDQRAEKR